MKKKKGQLTTVILVLIMIVGLSLLLYPTVSDYWNSFHQTRAIENYTEVVSQLDPAKCERLKESARKYNTYLRQGGHDYILNEDEKKDYERQLNIAGDGVMGYVQIPCINVSLPIYHGIDEAILQVAIGHLPWSSLPVGGKSTHCVISGHRGLPSAKLFSNLDRLVEGDIFMLNVLDETLIYEVDQILIVKPKETEELQVVEGKDYCTLVTCTPYGVNSHRLLVRGHRIKAEDLNEMHISPDATQIEPLIVAPIVAVPILLILIGMIFLPGRKNKKDKRGGKE
ncbi:MAG: class C sortase [Eubacteriaceae bacterium]|nr:class C sortase [Eubacteriaceae bacterium]